MNKSDMTLIIPVYNGERTINACICAVLESNCLPDEIIIVNDCSTDNTVEQIKKWMVRYPNLIRLISAKKNSGPATARNLGVSQATSSYLFFIDSDTEILPDALTLFLKHIKVVDAVVGVYDLEPLSRGVSSWYKSLLYGYLQYKNGIKSYDKFSASCAGIRKEIYEKVGGYNEKFISGIDFENEEFGSRIAEHYHMIIDPSMRVKHHFPRFKKMTSTFFKRTMLWIEMLMVRRRQFNLNTNFIGIGTSSMALLAAVLTLPFAFLFPLGYFLPMVFYLIFLYNYGGFLLFVLLKYPKLFCPIFFLNVYYTLVVASGACCGFIKVLIGKSWIAKEFSYKEG